MQPTQTTPSTSEEERDQDRRALVQACMKVANLCTKLGLDAEAGVAIWIAKQAHKEADDAEQ